jgi:hypothetical protein
MKEKFEVLNKADQEKIEYARNEILNPLSIGHCVYPPRKSEELGLTKDFFRKAIKEGMTKAIFSGFFIEPDTISEEFGLSEKEVENIIQESAKEAMVKRIQEGSAHGAGNISDDYNIKDGIFDFTELCNLSENKVKEIAIRRLAGETREGRFYSLSLEEEKMLEEAFHTEKWLKKCIYFGNVEEALALKKELNISGLAFFQKYFPEFLAYLKSFREILPKLTDKWLADPWQALWYFEMNQEDRSHILRELKENPFLANAFENNPRYAPKLIVKWPELDKESKENISFLYSAKAECGDIAPDSVQFRAFMQDKLLGYKNNAHILEKMEKEGINIKQWLNYDKEEIFSLGEEGKKTFSEKAKLPITRLEGTIERYAKSFKDIAKKFREKLSGATVETETEKDRELLEKLIKEKETALLGGQAEKADGIARGMAQLEQKIKNPKMVSVWDRVMGDVGGLERVCRDVISAYKSAEEAENNISVLMKEENIPGDERRSNLTKAKNILSDTEKEFRQKLQLLEMRMLSFEENTQRFFSDSLGQDAGEEAMTSFKRSIAEEVEHLRADMSAIEKLFEGEKSDSLIGNPMSIRVWTRDPDRDLYLGNYTDCCIRIDSEHMGEESTIADYLTDLGIQVIVIEDTKRKIPVVAAWSFPGENNFFTDIEFIVDNIEANTDYSMNHEKQITEKLRAYIEEYAKSAGMKKVVQGKYNNDIVIDPLISEKEGKKYIAKLGGYNRKGGYFLEAEA